MYFPYPNGQGLRDNASRRTTAPVVGLFSLSGTHLNAVTKKGASATRYEAAVPRQLAVRSGMLSGMRAQGADA
ncbi:MAG TPA: hypothetical protein VIJ34_00115 [Acidimicrobiales bacterium]